jgi:glucose/arabinose dehydrogenase/photosystem II stability/assembly factor-like uncharacterized protein
MIHNLKSLLFSLLLIPLIIGITPIPLSQAGDQQQTQLDNFDLLTVNSGWVLIDKLVLWTSDAGKTWDEIGPEIPIEAKVQAIEFLDSTQGMLLWTIENFDGSANFTLARTIDHGVTWSIQPLSLFESGEISANVEKAGMGWFDAQTGWIAVKQQSSSNFSLGTLFTTSDGGGSWVRSNLPIADQVIFDEPRIGWAIGGPTSDQIFQTKDNGVTWQDSSPDYPDQSVSVVYKLFYESNKSILVTINTGAKSSLNIYSLDDAFDRWHFTDQVPLNTEPGIIGLSILDSENFVAIVPGTNSIIQMKDSEFNVINDMDGNSASIVDLDMVSLEVGWARSVESNCAIASPLDDESASVSCTSSTRLLSTQDGGVTWDVMYLPTIYSNNESPGDSGVERSLAINTSPGVGNTNKFFGQGFDKCEIPTVSQLQTWWDNSPYKAVNLYIGGSSRACTNSALTASYLEQLNQQGWKFIPTWVGPQAPCTAFSSRMSSDAATAYTQGVNEANLAVEKLAELGLTYADKTGSVAYYDIEYYGTNAACRVAVNSFMNGWVSQMHARGNLAGVYGSTLCNTGLSDFLEISNVPDVIWPARWYHNTGEGFYDPHATVWNLGDCIPDSVWADHQRIRQYEGDHNETWGTLTLGIDSNVLDGVVAVPYPYPYPTLDPARISFQEISSGLSNPIFITHARDGSERMFVVERRGRIRIIKNGALLSTPFLDIQSIVKSTNGEQGLLGLAFHPSYESNGKFYVVYTAPRNGDSNGSVLTLRQYSVSSGNPDVATVTSGINVLTIDHPTQTNHNGGTIAFGNDGYLYWSTGDGGGGGDPSNNAQNLTSLLGKILRLDVDSGSPYSVPATNPFYSSSNTNTKLIWAYGLRNPWRMSFDRVTHDLYIGDVGQSNYEEIDYQSAGSAGGENYGWRVMEGSFCYNPSSGCDKTGKILPVAEYDHSLGCSVTGGYVYRGSSFPSLAGHYI